MFRCAADAALSAITAWARKRLPHRMPLPADGALFAARKALTTAALRGHGSYHRAGSAL